jgi:hypothetical protein
MCIWKGEIHIVIMIMIQDVKPRQPMSPGGNEFDMCPCMEFPQTSKCYLNSKSNGYKSCEEEYFTKKIMTLT